MRITDTHIYFWDGHFSNWSPSPFKIGECQFANAEQCFMFQKALYFFDTEMASKILQETDPARAKALGRLVKNYNDAEWNEVRFKNMVFVNMFKYEQNQIHRATLTRTDSRILVEASPFDKIWGVGLREGDDQILDEKNWLGQNLLGKALMEVRNKLKE